MQSFHNHQHHRVARSWRLLSFQDSKPPIVLSPAATMAEHLPPVLYEHSKIGCTIKLPNSSSATDSDSSSATFTLSKASSTSSLPTSLPPLEALPITFPLPAEKRDEKPFRLLRHSIFTVYRRLFSLVIAANIIGLVFIDHRQRDNNSYIKVSLSIDWQNRTLLTLRSRLYRVLPLVICSLLSLCAKTISSISYVKSSLQLQRVRHSVFVESSPKCSNLGEFILVLQYAPRSGSFDSLYISPSTSKTAPFETFLFSFWPICFCYSLLQLSSLPTLPFAKRHTILSSAFIVSQDGCAAPSSGP